MYWLRARRRPGGCGYGEASPRPGRRRRHPARAVIALNPPAARRSRRPFRPGARAAGGTGDPRASPPRRALAGVPQQASRDPGALRADAGYLAAQARARAARGEHIAGAIGGSRIAPLGRPPDGTAGDDWREATGMGRRPGRRGGLPARLVPGEYVAAAPPGPGGPVDGPVR